MAELPSRACWRRRNAAAIGLINLIYSSAGWEFSHLYASGLSSPYGLVIQPVPEPATWALLVGGLIALLSVKRCQDGSATHEAALFHG